MILYGIWCKDVGTRSAKMGAWLRENSSNPANPILAFESKQAACRRAADHYGFPTYSEAKRRDWCEVRPLN